MDEADIAQRNLNEYMKRFGSPPDSRRMPDEILATMDVLIAKSLDRNAKISDKEAGLLPVPDGVTI